MLNKLLASLFAALVISFVFSDVGSAQSLGPNLKQYQQRRMNRGIDDGMVRRAPRIGDERMARKAPENIDDGIFKPGRVFNKYHSTTKPKMDKR